jgi:excisionase family DNA binding protein
MTTDRLLPVEEAGRRLGVPYRTMRRRIEDGTLKTYRHDRDRRQKLVAIDDVAALFRPQPADARQEVEPVSAA